MNNGNFPRLCFLIDGFPPVAGGLELHAYYLAEKLISKKLELFVLTRRIELSLPKFEKMGNVPVIRFLPGGWLQGRGWKILYVLPFLFANIFFLLLKYFRQYDIILVSGFKVFSIPAAVISLISRKKIIVKIESPEELWNDNHPLTLQKLNLSIPMKTIRGFMLNLLGKIRSLLIKRVDSFIAISSEIKRGLIDLGVNPQKIHSIPNAIRSDKFFPVSRQEKGKIRQDLFLPEEKIIFIYTGRLAVSKGVLILIEVWKEVLSKYKCIHLVFAGGGKYSFDSCEIELKGYLNKYNIGDSVTLTGEVDNVDEYLKASDIFVFPSDFEGFSLGLIEALACALPVVVTNVGAAGDIIRNYENGILITPKDHFGLKASIEWMLENKSEWEAIGQRAHETSKIYNIETVANLYLAKIQECFEYRN